MLKIQYVEAIKAILDVPIERSIIQICYHYPLFLKSPLILGFAALSDKAEAQMFLHIHCYIAVSLP